MTHELVYSIINKAVIPAWLLLIFLPNHNITKWVVYSYLYPFVLGAAYVFFIFFGMDQAAEVSGDMFSLENIKIAFQRNDIMIGGWLHYLIFDLFIGSWIARDAIRNGINQWLLAPVLAATLFFGPMGLMIYLGIRWVKTGSFVREAVA